MTNNNMEGKRLARLKSAKEIMETDFPDVSWVISNILSTGLGILAGTPKIGKSWLALQIAKHVATGNDLFGEATTAGNVLILALEDPGRRLKSRIIKQQWPENPNVNFLLLRGFEESIGDFRNGGLKMLEDQIQEDNSVLLIIDTLSRISYSDQNDVNDMTRLLSPLQGLAHENDLSILIIDHHTKASNFGKNPIKDVLGSTGKTGVADTVMGLYRENSKSTLSLEVTGRDIESRKIDLKMDWKTGLYSLVSEEGKHTPTDQEQKILNAIEKLGSPTLSEIVAHTGEDKGNTSKRMKSLVSHGLIVLEENKYKILKI